MIGAICGQAPLSALVDSVGWKHSMLYLSFFGVIFACAFYLCIRDKKIEVEVINKFDHKPRFSIFSLLLSDSIYYKININFKIISIYNV